jgi:23S rRNA (uridine2552-2'-O)-methyltransferase
MKQHIKTAKGRKISSTKWLERQLNDPFSIKAKKEGYRSRASFKIIEMDKKFNFLKRGQKVLDLGCSPGGWSQVLVNKVGKYNVTGIDLIDMDIIDGVKFIKCNFLNLDKSLIEDNYDVIVSDMAANTTGNREIDHLRTIELAENSFDFATKHLKKNGIYVTKVFQGNEEPLFFNNIKRKFSMVKHFKPEASRKESVEIYIIAIGFN